jgi:hypothetical protein
MAERVTDTDRGYERAVELLGRDTADELNDDALEAFGVMARLQESGELQEMMETGDFSALPSEVRPSGYGE